MDNPMLEAITDQALDAMIAAENAVDSITSALAMLAVHMAKVDPNTDEYRRLEVYNLRLRRAQSNVTLGCANLPDEVWLKHNSIELPAVDSWDPAALSCTLTPESLHAN